MAKTDLPTQTAACEVFGRHGSCRGVLLSLTDANMNACSCSCHRPTVADLPDAWREQAVLTPPCDADVDLDEVAGDLIADRALENEYVDRVWS
jgi:hypothetical protein